MTTAKWTINTGEQQDLHYRAPRLNEKWCLPVLGGDNLTRNHISLNYFVFWFIQLAHCELVFV
jgi:hypothetical protein